MWATNIGNVTAKMRKKLPETKNGKLHMDSNLHTYTQTSL